MTRICDLEPVDVYRLGLISAARLSRGVGASLVDPQSGVVDPDAVEALDAMRDIRAALDFANSTTTDTNTIQDPRFGP